jgi:hypothetical protein
MGVDETIDQQQSAPLEADQPDQSLSMDDEANKNFYLLIS